MARTSLHDPEALLDAVRELALTRGLASVTMEAVSTATGAPTGSIYHRFRSRDEMLARTWMRAARRSQAELLEASAQTDPVDAVVAAARSVVGFARRHPDDARLLAAYRREDFLQAAGPALAAELGELNRPVEEALARLARELTGGNGRAAVERVAFAVVDIPLAAIRRSLLAGRALPRGLERDAERAVRAVAEGLAR